MIRLIVLSIINDVLVFKHIGDRVLRPIDTRTMDSSPHTRSFGVLLPFYGTCRGNVTRLIPSSQK